jgi:hypothetical protein
MAAGQGFKTFTTGEVLTAGDVNGYLMQGILVFASEAARDAAITSPQEGQFAFTKDTNSTWYYDGAAWVVSGATGDVTGVTAGTGITVTDPTGPVPTVTNSMATAIDAKGDLIAGTGADAFSRLSVGTDDQVLTADSAEATGLKWAAPAGAGSNWSLLNAGGTALTGSATITVSGISGKNGIMVVFVSASSANASATLGVRINTDTTTKYDTFGTYVYSPATYVLGGISQNVTNAAGTYIPVGIMSGSDTSAASGYCLIQGTNAAGVKPFQAVAGFNRGGDDSQQNYIVGGVYTGTSVVSSISMFSTSGNFDAGTVYVYTTA